MTIDEQLQKLAELQTKTQEQLDRTQVQLDRTGRLIETFARAAARMERTWLRLMSDFHTRLMRLEDEADEK